MKFGKMLKEIKKGKVAYRLGWNGNNQFIFLIKARDMVNAVENSLGGSAVYEIQDALAIKTPEGESTACEVQDVLAIKTSKNQVQVGWLATQSDILSEDWESSRLLVNLIDGTVSFGLNNKMQKER